jgi:DNA invertase Pin-like site-specific DNA recombinase
MKIGYARVSTDDQKSVTQVDKLKADGCERIFDDTASGSKMERPKLKEALNFVRDGDVLVVWKLDRLTRSLSDLLFIMQKLTAKNVGFRSLTESIDTTAPSGRMMMQLLGSFAEFEREQIRERTKAGLARARAKGKIGGRKQELSARRQAEVIRLVRSGEKQAAVAREHKVSKATVCRIMQRAEGKAALKDAA